jgi:hypothetical protein
MGAPPTFVDGSGVPGGPWGMKRIPPCSLCSLVGMKGLCAGLRSIVTASESQNPHSVAKCATRRDTVELCGFGLLGTELREGLNLFGVRIV